MSAPIIPPRRSLAFFAALAMMMTAISYLLLLLLAIACVYVPWLILTSLTNFQTLAVFIAGVIVAGSMLWSVVPRRDKFIAPGLRLEPVSHPRLFAELENIANVLQEPLPSEVYLVGEPNAWVADRGGVMGLGSRRVMGLGLPLLSVLDISQFRALLAHEFAHYYGGDTKLGPLLYNTQGAMVRTLQNMSSVGQTMRIAVMQVLFVMVFSIVKWYWLLFLRAIRFVSRRQEFRADELACVVAGPEPLITGLQTIHGAAFVWPGFVRNELNPMLSMGCLPSITDGFRQFLAHPTIAQQAEKEVELTIRQAKTMPYDTHPPLRDRLAAAEKLYGPPSALDARPALSLLDNVGNEEARFLRAVNPALMEKPLKRVKWEEKGSSVLVPAWTKFVVEYSSLLTGMTIGNLPESIGKVPEIAPRIRDPKGMLLTPGQRIERARSLLSTALDLALIRSGWILQAGPGDVHLMREGEQEGEQMSPYKLLTQLSDGRITKDAWTSRCAALGIGDVALGLTTKAVDETTQSSLGFS